MATFVRDPNALRHRKPMFKLLLKTRMLGGRNAAREMWRNKPVTAVAMCVGGTVLFAGMFLAFLIFFRFAAALGVLDETLYQAYYYFFLLLLAGAVPFVGSTLFQSADYSLLFAAPVPPRTVVAAKLLESTVTNSLQFTVLGFPAIVASAAAVGIAPVYWLLLPPIIALFVLLPALLTAFALLLALAAFGMRRLRTAITTINVLMGMTVCITFVLEARNLPLKLGDLSGGIGRLQPALTATSMAAHLAPSQWFARALIALGNISPVKSIGIGAASSATPVGFKEALQPLALLCICVAGLFIASVLLGGKLLSAASVAEEGEESGTIRSAAGFDPARYWRRIFAAPAAAVVAKDLRYFRRDTMLLSQMAVPLILYAVPFLIALRDRSTITLEELYPFSALIIVFILFVQSSVLSLSFLGMEGQSYWVALNAPVARSSALWAKWWLSALLTGGIGVLLSLFAAFAFRAPWQWAAAHAAGIVLGAGGLCGIGVGLSAIFPRFIHENPALRVSAWALILSFFVTMAYLTVSLVVVAVSFFMAANAANAPGGGTVFYVIGTLIFVALTVMAIGLPMAYGARRLENYEWEH